MPHLRLQCPEEWLKPEFTAATGFSAIKPVYEFKPIRKLNLSLIGQANLRYVSLRARHGQSSKSIETLYTEATAPGLANQPAFLQAFPNRIANPPHSRYSRHAPKVRLG